MSEPYDYDAWEAEEYRLTKHARMEWLESRPTCAWCGERITDEFAYEFPNGDVVCEECVSEYIEEYRIFLGR
jgi:formylmethanofuran dehydrogenase subunit E